MLAPAEANVSKPRRRPRWPFIIVGLLGLHVTGMVIAVTIAQRDRGMLIVPNYYDKAQHWDAAQAERRASRQLGWTVRTETALKVDAQGRRAVCFVLTDAKGAAVPGARLHVDYFHHAHPNQQNALTLAEPDRDDPTRFTQLVSMPYPGVWEFHFTATVVEKTFVDTQTHFLSRAD